ncbi:hypothetical protein [Nostoc sp.]|uniref:hypothetical protein n=1 Tax=Nostoc sp. TaxID=1180 RepID=UPI002FFC656D
MAGDSVDHTNFGFWTSAYLGSARHKSLSRTILDFGEAAQFSPYSPSPKEDALAFGHPTAGASVSVGRRGATHSEGFPQVEEPAVWAGLAT